MNIMDNDIMQYLPQIYQLVNDVIGYKYQQDVKRKAAECLPLIANLIKQTQNLNDLK